MALRVHDGIWESDYSVPIQEYIRLRKDEAAHAKMSIILNFIELLCCEIMLVDKSL